MRAGRALSGRPDLAAGSGACAGREGARRPLRAVTHLLPPPPPGPAPPRACAPPPHVCDVSAPPAGPRPHDRDVPPPPAEGAQPPLPPQPRPTRSQESRSAVTLLTPRYSTNDGRNAAAPGPVTRVNPFSEPWFGQRLQQEARAAPGLCPLPSTSLHTRHLGSSGPRGARGGSDMAAGPSSQPFSCHSITLVLP